MVSPSAKLRLPGHRVRAARLPGESRYGENRGKKMFGLWFNVSARVVPLGDLTPSDRCCAIGSVPFFEVGFFLSPHLLLIFFLLVPYLVRVAMLPAARLVRGNRTLLNMIGSLVSEVRPPPLQRATSCFRATFFRPLLVPSCCHCCLLVVLS